MTDSEKLLKERDFKNHLGVSRDWWTAAVIFSLVFGFASVGAWFHSGWISGSSMTLLSVLSLVVMGQIGRHHRGEARKIEEEFVYVHGVNPPDDNV